MKPIYRNILFISFGTLLAVALLVLVIVSRRSNTGAICNGVKITVQTDSAGVLTEQDVRDFMSLHIAPSTSKPISDIDLAAIEQQLSKMPLVATAECYIDRNGVLCVEVTEMIPVMHVLGGNHDYCVDDKAHQMPTPPKLRRGVALVEGANVFLQFATGDLFNLIDYLQHNGWSGEFAEFRVGAGNKVSMRSKKYGYWVVLGVPDGYVGKLDKLTRFRHAVPDHTKYREINLDYYGEVVCK